MSSQLPTLLLSRQEIETILKQHQNLAPFWQSSHHAIIFRILPTFDDPVYEIQLVWNYSERLETYAWVWVDAWEGEVLKIHYE